MTHLPAIIIAFTIGCLLVALWIFDGGPGTGMRRHDDNFDPFA